MGDLSDRFGALMARMAKGDAELFRTVGEQNAAIRELVEELAPALPAETNTAAALQAAPQPLLPPEQCHPKALKARFTTAAAAHAHLETILGAAPTKKKTWDYLGSVFASGTWPAPAKALARSAAGRGGGAGAGSGAGSEEALAQLETRLLQRIDQLEDRLIAVLEKVLQSNT
jgi:hypothetical protein